MNNTIKETFSYSDSAILISGEYTITPNLSENTYNVFIKFDITNKRSYTEVASGLSALVQTNKINDLIWIEDNITFTSGQTKHFEGENNISYNPDGTLPTKNIIILTAPWQDSSSSNPNVLNKNLNEIMKDLSNGHMNINNAWEKGYFWRKINGVWKRCLIWKKINGIWKKGI